ncbi:MAG: 4Fe-4S binding protein [Deltaproteobacteria bacterium]|nr:MAG: 4Fe-4S binding protein [Deltaproteobacteria bacterium]
MMKKLAITLAVLSLLLLSAHFLRYGQWGLCFSIASFVALVFYRQAWLRWVLIVVLSVGVIVWADTWLNLVKIRMAFGQPWSRLSLIVGSVTALTAIAASLLLTERVRTFFNRDTQLAVPLAIIFGLTVLTLSFARHMASLPILLVDRFFPGWGWLQILLLGLYATWVGKKMIGNDTTSRLRPKIWGFFSLIFFAQLILGLAGVQEMLMTGKLHLPVPALIVGGPLYRGSGFFMLILFTVTVLLVGPAWCSYLCYIGAWDDYLCRRWKKRPKNLPSWLSHGRVYTLILVVATAIALRLWGNSAGVAVASAAIFGLVGVGVMAGFSSRRGMMVHCTAYCPIGVISNLMGKINPWRLRIDRDCNQCGACSKVCRYGALDMKNIEQRKPGLTCTLCGDCIASCKDSYIRYHFPGLDPSVARQAFLVVCITLHAAFLGVARM